MGRWEIGTYALVGVVVGLALSIFLVVYSFERETYEQSLMDNEIRQQLHEQATEEKYRLEGWTLEDTN